MKRSKYCIYTCITGGYDTIPEIKNKDKRIDYILFTNVKEIESSDWEVRYLPIKDHEHKQVKILGADYLPEYEISMWVDGQFSIEKSTFDLFQYLEGSEKDAMMFYHTTEGKTVEEEFKSNMIHGLDDYERIRWTKSFVDKFTFLQDKVLLGGVFLRKHNANTRSCMNLWWSVIYRNPETISTRDMLTLHYSLYQCPRFKVDKTPYVGFLNRYLKFKGHKNRRFPINKIYFISPFASNKQIGIEIDRHVEKLENDAWVVLTDYDVLFLTPNHYDLIRAAINHYPDTAVFGGYTNRIGLSYQLHGGKISNDFDVRNHVEIAKKRELEYGSECLDIGNNTIAGFLMVFSKATYDKVGGFQKMVLQDGKLFDYTFCEKAMEYGPMRLIKGLYVFHRYREHDTINPKTNIKHLINGK